MPDRIVIRLDGIVVGEHRRRFGRDETAYDSPEEVARADTQMAALRRSIDRLIDSYAIKKVALMACLSRTSKTCSVYFGCGPSSNVNRNVLRVAVRYFGVAVARDFAEVASTMFLVILPVPEASRLARVFVPNFLRYRRAA
jgi:hypothetical protein